MTAMPTDPAQRLQRKLDAMPPVAALSLSVLERAPGRLRLGAPLAANVNDKGCAFGGSLASLLTLSAWGLVTLELEAAGCADAEVYVQDSQLAYLAPLYGDLEAEARLADGQAWADFVTAYRERGRARATLDASAHDADGRVVTRFSGRFVALCPR